MIDDRNRTRIRKWLIAWAIAFTAIAVYGSLVPFHYRARPWDNAVAAFLNTPYLQLGAENRADWVANILLFVPIGFLWLGVASLGFSRLGAALVAMPIVAACGALSVLIEFVQLWFPPRTVSQNDMLAETIGAGVGCMLWIAIGNHACEWVAAPRQPRDGRSLLRRLLMFYSIGFAIYSVMPLDLTISVTELYHKFRDGKIVLVPFADRSGSAFQLAYEIVRDIACLVPVGAYAAICLLPAGRAVHGAARATLQGMAYVVLLELSQLLVYSRYTDAADLLTGFVGICMGVIFMRRCVACDRQHAAAPERRPAAWIAAAAAVAFALALAYWYPYNFSLDPVQAKPKLDAFATALFAPLYWKSEFEALGVVLLKTITFALLGACLGMAIGVSSAREPGRKVLRFVAAAACAAFGLVIELGQILMSGHTAHVTDVVLYTLGSIVGLTIATSLLASSPRGHQIELRPAGQK